IISNSIIIVFSSVMIGMRNIWVLIAILFMAIIVGYILGWFGKRDKIKFQDVMAPTNRKLNYLERTSKNFDFAKDIRLFNMSGVFKREFAVLNNFFFKKNRQHHNRWIIGALCMESVLLSETLVMYGWLVWSVLKGEMAISDLLLFIGLVNSLHRNIGFMSWIYSAVKTNTLMINDYREFVNWKEDSESFAEGEGVEKNLDFDSYEFKFENVSFKYPGHDNYVLKNINLTIKNDSKLAVVGINGAGKTTLIKLIMKLYNPTEGRILLNGRDLRDFDRDEYFKLFSPVFQNIECFALPIFENVSFEVEEETDMDKVTSALERSGLLEKIDMYDAGIRVNLLKIFDEKGIDLSGGEKQKLALARALYKDAPIVILDEPTAALDALAEDRMYREFNNMVKNKIAIFISHRLGSTRFCDQIAMFKEGEIVELGTHSELLEKNGEYAEMFNIQSSYYKDEEVISHG
ncbi:MAG: ABC transporter ATP-binding protein, partial [Eubacterium sp.]|nr:ABC transporter ATP-binding protein [Eubacterium sp.]